MQFSRHNAQMTRRDHILGAAGAALDTLVREARQALRWTTTSGAELVFEIPDPQAIRLPRPPENRLTPLWDPFSGLLRVRYRAQGGAFWREVWDGSAFRPTQLCESVQGFAGRRVGQQMFQVTLTLELDANLQPLGQTFRLPCQQSWGPP